MCLAGLTSPAATYPRDTGFRSCVLPGEELLKLIALMARLRGPEGCPWDRAQNYDSIKGLLLEEAYEVVDAVGARDFDGIEDELGDLLFQVVFYSRLAEEQGRFSIDDVIKRVHAKLVRRHPHVFGDSRARTPEEALESWNTVKRAERAERSKLHPEPAPSAPSLLDGISPSLPATLQAYELGVRAAEAGFDWVKAEDLLDKIEEELRELRDELQAVGERPEIYPPSESLSAPRPTDGLARIEEETGDLLFAVANLARFVHSDPESCLRRANRKFEGRFRELEQELVKRGKTVSECTPQELDDAWNQVKSGSRKSP
jgi:ATP diphosphatase